MSGDASAEASQLRKEAKEHGLDDEKIIQSLENYGVANLSQIVFFGEDDFKELKLPGFKIKQLKDLKKELKESQESQSARGRCIDVSGSKANFGVVTGGATAGIVKMENARPDQGNIRAHGAEIEAERVENKAAVHSVHIKNIENLPPQPEDLILEETDEVVKVMTDGPDTVQVLHCSRPFYDQHRLELQTVYSMSKSRRGKVAIVNVNKVEGADPREGTDIDRDKLADLFSQLHFDVQVWNDEDGLTAEEIEDKVANFAKEADKEDGQACVVCLLSHGKEDCLAGTDGRLLPFDTIFSLFDDKHCPNLVGKPKLFIFQACRKGEPNIGKLKSKEGERSDMMACYATQQDEPNIGKLKSNEGGRSDMMVCYATQQGYAAFRNTTNGSWFVESIVKVFAKYAGQEEIVHMMYRVNYALQKQLKIQTAENVSPEFRSTFGKKLFFFPGIQE